MNRVVLGTRGSPLALWQARHVAGRLESAHHGLRVEIRTIRTQGDASQELPFGQLRGRGFFVKEIEAALVSREIDLAVHSLKDLPTEIPEPLAIAAVLERHDPRDAILSEAGWELHDLPPGTLLATGSPRRRCQLLHARPDLRATEVRGNVDTRLRKLREGRFGALVLALAGVERLGLDAVPVRPLSTAACLPAVGQGALAIETRREDAATRRLAASLTHERTLREVSAERAFLARLGGGCLAPATAFARIDDDRLRIEAMLGDPDGRRLLRDAQEGPPGEEETVGAALAERMLAAGGEAILREARASSGGSFPG